VAEQSILWFVATHDRTYFWTNTFADDACCDHKVAVARCKPLFDLLRRKGVDYLFFWEKTKKGRWHLHWICDQYIHVTSLRDFLTERGWGQQMRVEKLWCKDQCVWDGQGWVFKDQQDLRAVRYLTKYMTKAFTFSNPNDKRIKIWGGPGRCKIGNVQFKWVPWINAKAMLYYWGRQFFFEVNGHYPNFTNIEECIRLGYEVTNWGDIDPWFLDTS